MEAILYAATLDDYNVSQKWVLFVLFQTNEKTFQHFSVIIYHVNNIYCEKVFKVFV